MADLISYASMSKKDEGLKFITGYHYATSLLKLINNVTFLYDPNWEMDTQGNNVTLPIAFFHVVKMNEVMESEVQTKKVLFYNSQSTTNTNVVRGSTVNVIADNIVNKPKSYKLDVIIPYEDLTLTFNSSLYQMPEIVAQLTDTTVSSNYGNVVKGVEVARKLISMLVSTLQTTTNLSSASTISYNAIENITSTPMYNKNSLEAMWRNRTILKMKLWNGWKFVYVAIKDIDVYKESTEEGVEHATITVTELPIMVMHTKRSTNATKNWFQKLVGGVSKTSGVAVKAVAKTIAEGW